VRYPYAKRVKGFTLIEIIVAMTILGLSMVAVLQVFSLGLSSSRRSQKVTMAVSVAKNIMEEVISRDSIEAGYEQGSIEEFGIDYSIDINPGELAGLHVVEVSVGWTGGERVFALFCQVPQEASGFSVFPK